MIDALLRFSTDRRRCQRSCFALLHEMKRLRSTGTDRTQPARLPSTRHRGASYGLRNSVGGRFKINRLTPGFCARECHSTTSTGRFETGICRSVMWSPSARKSRPITHGAASGESMECPRVDRHVIGTRAPPSRLGTGPVPLSPFRTRAAHIVQLGPIRVAQRVPQPAPASGSQVEDAARRRARK